MKANRGHADHTKRFSPRDDSATISGRHCIHNANKGEAYYMRHKDSPRHPDATYTVPHRDKPGWRVDVIILGIVLVGTIVLILV